MSTPDQQRTPTPIDAIADAWVETLARLDPISATGMGIAGHDHRWPDFSPAGHQETAQAVREVLAALDAEAPVDETDEVTLAAMRERLGLHLELHEADELMGELNNIASPTVGRIV